MRECFGNNSPYRAAVSFSISICATRKLFNGSLSSCHDRSLSERYPHIVWPKIDWCQLNCHASIPRAHVCRTYCQPRQRLYQRCSWYHRNQMRRLVWKTVLCMSFPAYSAIWSISNIGNRTWQSLLTTSRAKFLVVAHFEICMYCTHYLSVWYDESRASTSIPRAWG